MSKHKVVHFEIPASDFNKAKDFYGKVFGWGMQAWGDEYLMAMTTEVDKEQKPTEMGGINGGFYKRKADFPAQYPSLVIAVDDIGESMKKVTDGGGKVLGEPMEIPGIGTYVSFLDTEGNRVSMMQPLAGM